MSCTPCHFILRLCFSLITFIIASMFILSVVWMLKGPAKTSDEYYLHDYTKNSNVSRHVNSELNRTHELSNSSHTSNTTETLMKMEIAIRRVEENSRRLKEYTRSLLWNNKDKSLWCILFKDSVDKNMNSVQGDHKHDRKISAKDIESSFKLYSENVAPVRHGRHKLERHDRLRFYKYRY